MPGTGKKIYIEFEGDHFDFPKAYANQLRYLAGIKKGILFNKENEVVKEETFNEKAELKEEVVVTTALKPKKNLKKAIIAGALGIGLLLGVKSCSYNNSKVEVPNELNNPGFEQSYNVEDVTTYTKPDVPGKEEIKPETPVLKEEISLGSYVDVDHESKLYSNSYDSTFESNGLNRYYNNDDLRYVAGLTFSLNGNLITVYSDDVDSEKTMNDIIKSGGEVTSVLTKMNKNDMQYEGYNNIDDVTLANSRGAK